MSLFEEVFVGVYKNLRRQTGMKTGLERMTFRCESRGYTENICLNAERESEREREREGERTRAIDRV